MSKKRYPEPTNVVIRDATRIINRIWREHEILPSKIVQYNEGGIHVNFESKDKVITIDLNNDNKVSVIIQQNEVIETIDIPGTVDRERLICRLVQKILKN